MRAMSSWRTRKRAKASPVRPQGPGGPVGAGVVLIPGVVESTRSSVRPSGCRHFNDAGQQLGTREPAFGVSGGRVCQGRPLGIGQIVVPRVGGVAVGEGIIEPGRQRLGQVEDAPGPTASHVGGPPGAAQCVHMGLCALRRGWRPRSRATGAVFHGTPQASNSRSR